MCSTYPPALAIPTITGLACVTIVCVIAQPGEQLSLALSTIRLSFPGLVRSGRKDDLCKLVSEQPPYPLCYPYNPRPAEPNLHNHPPLGMPNNFICYNCSHVLCPNYGQSDCELYQPCENSVCWCATNTPILAWVSQLPLLVRNLVPLYIQDTPTTLG